VRPALDVIVVTPEDVAGQGSPAPVIPRALSEGRVLYART
jgi:hypothetical protein